MSAQNTNIPQGCPFPGEWELNIQGKKRSREDSVQLRVSVSGEKAALLFLPLF